MGFGHIGGRDALVGKAQSPSQGEVPGSCRLGNFLPPGKTLLVLWKMWGSAQHSDLAY